MKKYAFFEHTADIKFQAFGKRLGESFENSALAMFNSISSQKIKPRINKKIEIKGRDLENLLYNFLEELLFLLDTEDYLISKIKIQIKEHKKELKLIANMSGDKAKNYELKMDVKAVTYNEMFVKKIKNSWVCQVVLDV